MRLPRLLVLVSLWLAGCQPAGGVLGVQNFSLPPPAIPAPSPVVQATPAVSPSPPPPSPPRPVESPVRSPVNLPVPFGSQAPYAVWDDLHNEACEEAAMLMANAYRKGEKLTPHLMEQGILNLVKWQTEHGYSVDVTATETAKILQEYFGLTARLVPAPTAANIRAELDFGRAVIVPAAGRKLGNPNFRRPGPIYHMLVIRGYDAIHDEFITNDPGTRKGEGYRYTTNVLMAAIHDWPKPGKTKADVTDAEMEAGQAVAIVVER